MARICSQKTSASSVLELDIFSDMHQDADLFCPAGWTDETPDISCLEEELQKSCYKCDGKNRRKINYCRPESSGMMEECPEGYSDYPVSCSTPTGVDFNNNLIIPNGVFNVPINSNYNQLDYETIPPPSSPQTAPVSTVIQKVSFNETEDMLKEYWWVLVLAIGGYYIYKKNKVKK